MPESQHISGENFVYQTKRYLEATLTIEVTWTVYDESGMTVLGDLMGTAHTYDLLAKLKEGSKSPIYVEAKKREQPSDINTEFDRFLGISFSCFVANRTTKNPYFMFVASRPFKMTNYHLLTTHGHLSRVIGNCEAYGIRDPKLQDILDFSSRLWFVIWSNKQDLMVVADPALYSKLGLRGVSANESAL